MGVGGGGVMGVEGCGLVWEEGCGWREGWSRGVVWRGIGVGMRVNDAYYSIIYYINTIPVYYYTSLFLNTPILLYHYTRILILYSGS